MSEIETEELEVEPDELKLSKVASNASANMLRNIMGKAAAESQSGRQFAYTITVPGYCTISFLCSEEKAEKFVKLARKEIQKLFAEFTPVHLQQMVGHPNHGTIEPEPENSDQGPERYIG